MMAMAMNKMLMTDLTTGSGRRGFRKRPNGTDELKGMLKFFWIFYPQSLTLSK